MKNELDLSNNSGLNYYGLNLQSLSENQKQAEERRRSFEESSQSIEKAIPVPQVMLSHSEDAYQPQNRQYQQKQRDNFADLVPEELRNIVDFSFIDGLDLKKLVFIGTPSTKPKDDNKNVLRNFGNAQNHYVLYHKNAREHIKKSLEDSSQFDNWVRSLKLQNFEQFKKVWRDKRKLFARLYRELCWQFYTQSAIPFVFCSRIKKTETRVSHLRQIHRFLKGIANPNQFTSFKRIW